MVELLKELKLPQGCITFEISEKHRFLSSYDAQKAIQTYRKQGFTIALDDFGMGYSGLELLYQADPDFIKIDRFFIQNLEKDPRKYQLVSALVKLSTQLGFEVIAEGIETKAEYLLCKKLGCTYAQGYFIEYPSVDIKNLKYFFGMDHLMDEVSA